MDWFPGSDTAETYAGWTLLLPAVSIGNAGQLAVDLLVQTLRLQCAGWLDSQQLLPCIGTGAYDNASTQLQTALQLYALPAHQLAVLQQRAPPIRGRQTAFAAELASWIAQAGFAQARLS